jgi:hypothetical protein
MSIANFLHPRGAGLAAGVLIPAGNPSLNGLTVKPDLHPSLIW